MLTYIETYMLFCENEGDKVSLDARLQEDNTWMVKIVRKNGFTMSGDSICLTAAFEILEIECKMFINDPALYMSGDR